MNQSPKYFSRLLFENKYVRTKKVASEFYYFCFIKRSIVMHCILISIFLLNLFFWVLDTSNSWITFLIPLYYAFFTFVYFMQRNALIKRDEEIAPQGMNITVSATNEYIEVMSSLGAVTKFDYSRFKKAYQTKNLIILPSKAKHAVILHKSAFTLGSTNEFLAFLYSKGISI